MSRTKTGSKAPGCEFWSRRPMSGATPNAETKRICHAMERAKGRESLRKALVEGGA